MTSKQSVKKKVLIITQDILGARMAGPAIRAWNLALVLSQHFEVRLVSAANFNMELPSAPFEVLGIRGSQREKMAEQERWADAILFQGYVFKQFPALKSSDRLLIADIYDPMHLEHLEVHKEKGAVEWQLSVDTAVSALESQLMLCDYFLCASERQRYFYLGQLVSYGRIRVSLYELDPSLRALIDVVPFGLSSQPPEHSKQVLRGVVPGIGVDDKILTWSGGIYNWFDPETLIRAVALLGKKHPEVRLFFQGTKHPNPGVPEMEVVARSRRLAVDLGVANRQVFFNDCWVEYEQRQNYLLEADAGVSTHFEHVETTFSFRTRILDYIWAQLPMVVTEGDTFSELVKERHLGLVVPERDPEALAAALERILYDQKLIEACQRNLEEIRPEFHWDHIAQPLIRAITMPPLPPFDRQEKSLSLERNLIDSMKPGFSRNLALLSYVRRTGGMGLLFRKINQRIKLKFRR